MGIGWQHVHRTALNLGGSQRITRLEMGKIICEMFGFRESRLLPTKMADIHLPAKRPQDLSFDISLAKQVLTTPLTDVFHWFYGAHFSNPKINRNNE
ncbi:MAG: hypothetical protein R3C26_08035 [Calditrichia bacterium]